MRWVALMPLRGGSKSIPGKNIRRIAGRPLYAWSLQQAVAAQCFNAIFVSTDSREIRDSVESHFGSDVAVIDRTAETASDDASTESVMLEFQQQADFDVLALIQATSPLTQAEHFVAAKQQFIGDKLESLLSAVEVKRFFWNRDGTPINYSPAARPRRQEFEGTLVENGAFYFTDSSILKEQRCRLGGKVGIFRMPAETYLEVDDPDDFVSVEKLLIKRKILEGWRGACRPIRALVVDVDGTLTDGGMYYDAEGERLKRFDTRDAVGLERLREHGIRVCIITGERSDITAARMKKLQITDYHPGVNDKLALLRSLARQWNLELEEIAFIGDDVGDVECLAHAGVSFCPRDAVDDVLAQADFVCAKPGGGGAVREVCELLLGAATLPARKYQVV